MNFPEMEVYDDKKMKIKYIDNVRAYRTLGNVSWGGGGTEGGLFVVAHSPPLSLLFPLF